MIGYSSSTGAVRTVALIDAETDPAERPDGDWWGSDAWMANRLAETDVRAEAWQ